MRLTECIISINLFDEEAKADSTITSTSNSTFADINNLSNDNPAVNSDYSLLELNNIVLDGSIQTLDLSDNDCNYISSYCSNQECKFETNPQIEITFNEVHSSYGLTLDFPGTLSVKKLNIYWYDTNNNLQSVEAFDIVQNKIYLQNSVSNYKKIVIEFLETYFPYQRVKLNDIDYGIELELSDEQISNATIHEEVDITGSELAIDTLDFTISSEGDEFNILDKSSLFYYIKVGQKVSVKENIVELDGENVVSENTLEMGTFYIDRFSNDTTHQLTISCIDLIGVLDKTNFIYGDIYGVEALGTQNATFESVVSKIMESAGVYNYLIDDSLKNLNVYGYLPVCTHRQALQQIAFSVGAVVDCCRTSNLRIYQPNMYANSSIGADRMFLTDSMEYMPNISKADIYVHEYNVDVDSDSVTLFKGNLKKGDNLIVFDYPMVGFATDVGTLVGEPTRNTAIINMTEDGECTATGMRYFDSYNSPVSFDIDTSVDNPISIKDCTTITSQNVSAVGNRIANFYKKQMNYKFSYLIDDEKTGEYVIFYNDYCGQAVGNIKSQTIDLAGGFISECEIVRMFPLNKDFSYCSEGYCNDNFVI